MNFWGMILLCFAIATASSAMTTSIVIAHLGQTAVPPNGLRYPPEHQPAGKAKPSKPAVTTDHASPTIAPSVDMEERITKLENAFAIINAKIQSQTSGSEQATTNSAQNTPEDQLDLEAYDDLDAASENDFLTQEYDFYDEPIDSVWASVAEAAIDSGMSDIEHNGQSVQVECRTSSCRVEMQLEDPLQLDQVLLGLRERVGALSLHEFYRTRDLLKGAPRVIVYFQKAAD